MQDRETVTLIRSVGRCLAYTKEAWRLAHNNEDPQGPGESTELPGGGTAVLWKAHCFKSGVLTKKYSVLQFTTQYGWRLMFAYHGTNIALHLYLPVIRT